MEISDFAKKVQERVSKVLKEETEISVREVCKNNGIILHGLMIMKKGQNVSPTIYLNSFLELYKQGMPLSEVVDSIISTYEKGLPKQKVDMEFFKNFSKVKDNIVFKLVNAEKNKELLRQIPHVPFLDLAICFCYAYYHQELGNGMILIYNSHVAIWETNTDELMRLAKLNSPKVLPSEYKSMESILDELIIKEGAGEGLTDEGSLKRTDEEVPIYILSNKNGTYGAASILYPGILEQIYESFSKSFYILPSSIHEVIVLEDDVRRDSVYLKEMVMEVNRSQVEPDEVLSDNVYYYDHNLKEMIII